MTRKEVEGYYLYNYRIYISTVRKELTDSKTETIMEHLIMPILFVGSSNIKEGYF